MSSAYSLSNEAVAVLDGLTGKQAGILRRHLGKNINRGASFMLPDAKLTYRLPDTRQYRLTALGEEVAQFLQGRFLNLRE